MKKWGHDVNTIRKKRKEEGKIKYNWHNHYNDMKERSHHPQLTLDSAIKLWRVLKLMDIPLRAREHGLLSHIGIHTVTCMNKNNHNYYIS